MTGDSQNMERSTLERKERAELAAVAAALGLKVPSRAKKADIVTLILDAVAEPGGGSVSGSEPADGRAADGAGNAGGADAEHDTSADGGSDRGSDRGSERVSSERVRGEDAAGETAADAAVESAGDEAGANSPSGDGTVVNGRGAGRRGADAPGSDDRGNVPVAPGRDRTAGPGDDASGDSAAEDDSVSGEASGADGEGEASSRSRRRRRRGRDRNLEQDAGDGEFSSEPVEVAGLLDLRDDGYGFLRVNGFLPGRDDVYVSVKQCRQLGLRKGDHLTGLARPATHKEKNPALTRVETVNGMDPDAARSRPRFDDHTPIVPTEEIALAGGEGDVMARIIGRLAPIAKGQRAVFTTTPGAERSGVVAALAGAIEASNPDLQMIVLSIGDRPEDVTAVRRVVANGEVVASTFDRPFEEHTAVAELTVEHAKRLVEYGYDVVIITDGLTQLGRAFNATTPPGGRILGGGLDAAAAYPVRRFLGAARNLEEGGSLTIVATLMTENGSPLDAAIADELRGAANRELRLDGDPSVVVTLDVSLPPDGQQRLLDELSR